MKVEALKAHTEERDFLSFTTVTSPVLLPRHSSE